MRRRTPYDREIFLLAFPALGALAAEPLYLLADTAIVGHLGTPQLAALALASTLLTGLATFCNFLTYGVTAQVARLHGAGEVQRAGAVAAQALWVATGLGILVAGLAVATAGPLINLLGGGGHVGAMATTFLRIGAVGLPFALIALAGQGYLRGIGDLRRPLIVVVVANVVNIILELVFVYRLHWGLAGSAWGTVIAQAGMGLAFALALLAAPPDADGRRPRGALMRPLLRMGSALILRTASLFGSFLVASAVLARVNAWVIERAQAFWPLFAAMQPIGAAVFALDGILLGAGETDYLAWSMLASSVVYVAVAALSLVLHWGIVGVWAGFVVLMLVRLATCGARFRSGRWVVVGAG